MSALSRLKDLYKQYKQLAIAKFKDSEFVRNSLIMVLATSIAQSLPVIFYPIVTRLYTPADFGIYNFFFSVVMLLGISMALKFERAIVVSDNTTERDKLFFLSIFISVAVMIILYVTIPLWKELISNKIDSSNKYISYLVPITSFLISIFYIYNNYFSKTKKYKSLAYSKILRTSVLVALQLALFKFHYSGLVLALILSFVITDLFLTYKLDLKKLLKTKLLTKDILPLAKKYKKFPIFNLPSTFLDRFAKTMMNYLILTYYTSADLGYFSLAYRLLFLPVIFIGQAIGQVFYQEFSDRVAKKQDILGTLKKFISVNLILSSIFYLSVLVLGKFVFNLFFPGDWAPALKYLYILIPVVFVISIYNPISTVFLAINKQEIYMYYQIIKNITIGLIFYLGGIYQLSFAKTLTIYSLAHATLLTSFILILYYKTKQFQKSYE